MTGMYKKWTVDTLNIAESPANVKPNPPNALERIQLWETPMHVIPGNLSLSTWFMNCDMQPLGQLNFG